MGGKNGLKNMGGMMNGANMLGGLAKGGGGGGLGGLGGLASLLGGGGGGAGGAAQQNAMMANMSKMLDPRILKQMGGLGGMQDVMKQMAGLKF